MASSTKDTKESGELPLQPSTVRNLSDKLYDKRKLGALEVEQLIKELNVAKDEEKIKGVIQYLVINFSDSSQGNSRKGGLIALAATAIGLGSEAHKYIPQLVPPVLKCFVDQDPRVRYYACESLYNIAKVARGKILIYFNEIFDALCKLSADPDINVKNGAQLLDRFVKDIVTESEKFDIEKFIPLLQERVYVINPYCRQFLIAWIVVLDSVPDIELLQYLPKFLDGLFNMLKDNTKDIRLEADACLAEFMREIKAMTASTSGNKRPVDFGSTVKILLTHSVSKDQFTRLTAIEWINEFIVIGREELLPFSAALLGSILPCLSSDVKNIRDASTKANNNLMSLITETTASFSINEILNTLISQLGNQNVPTRLASLSWILVLHSKVPDQLVSFIDDLFSVLLKTLSDSSDEVVRLDLEVMAKISMLNATFFRKLMDMLVDLFAHNRELLNSRASLIVRQLSLFISSQKIYITLAEILEIEEDLEFASVMIQTLNFILLTTKELTELRSTLKNLSAESTPDSVMKPTELFTVLYRSWSHNPVATFSLCLLSQLYEHAAALIVKFGDLDITVNLLVEVDKLVQLLESPVFIYLRLQLLEPENYPFLYKCLYGLLMLLPQSNAYETLRNRLNSLSSLGILQLIPKSNSVQTHPAQINFDDLLAHFQQVQKKHREFKKQNIQK